MIGQLPTILTIDGADYNIRSDFRPCLSIIVAYQDKELTKRDKQKTLLEILYEKIPENREEAMNQAVWFLDGGKEYSLKTQAKSVDFKQDEPYIFSGIANVAKRDIRTDEYCHWWTWLSYFMEIGEGVFLSVKHVRQKLSKGKKLEKWEREFYNDNKEIVDIKSDIEEVEDIIKALRGE